MLCCKKPLEAILGSDAVKAGAGAEMPDISPFSPFVHVGEKTRYIDIKQRFCKYFYTLVMVRSPSRAGQNMSRARRVTKKYLPVRADTNRKIRPV